MLFKTTRTRCLTRLSASDVAFNIVQDCALERPCSKVVCGKKHTPFDACAWLLSVTTNMQPQVSASSNALSCDIFSHIHHSNTNTD